MQSMAANNEMRANVYKLLSLCYQYPSADLEDVVTALAEQLDEALPQMKGNIKTMVEHLPDYSFQPQNLQVEYAKLFIGPFDLLAPPYGSVYLEDMRKVMGDTTMGVLEAYRQAGLEVDYDFKEPPDHIAAELEFMYFLIFKAIQGEETLEQQKRFLSKYLSPWIGPLAQKIAINTSVDFYKELAHITQTYLEADLKAVLN